MTKSMPKNIWSGFCTAFAMYSVLPVKQVNWEKNTMKYAMCFFPMVGLVIGFTVFLWLQLCLHWALNGLLFAAGMVCIPIAVSGAIHIDGLIDTADALYSRAETEKKLAILKDPHVGAFGVIVCVAYFLLCFGMAGQLYTNPQAIAIVCIGYVVSRAFSAFSIASFRIAKASGLAYTFADSAAKKAVTITALLYMLLGYAAMLWLGSGVFSFIAAALSIVWFARFRHMAYTQFGGLTGDLAGYFLCMMELLFLGTAALASIV